MISENTDFEGTDIPIPYEIPLPEKNMLQEGERDQIRDWVLEINMDGNVGNQLPTRVCEFCNYDQLYEASLQCPTVQERLGAMHYLRLPLDPLAVYLLQVLQHGRPP